MQIESKLAWLKVSDLTVENVSIGIFPHEKKIPQPVVVNIAVCTDITQAAHTDQFEHAVDYTEIAACIQKHCQSQHFDLLETLCETLSTVLMANFKLLEIDLEIKKPRALPNALVSVHIQRFKS